jgi:CRP-like cAMP-binding protein
MPAVSTQLAMRNRILTALPHEEFARLIPHLETVSLDKGKNVYLTGDDIQYAYFIDSGLLSFVSMTDTGSTIELAIVGDEGVVGLPVVLKNPTIPYDVTVVFPSQAFRIKAEALQAEFDRGETLHELVLRYVNLLINQISQSSICHRFHSLDQTLSKWLLTVQDRVKSNSLDFTHESISRTLGAPRTAVSKAAGELQKAGVIRYSRGRISILNRARLEAESCECYRIIRDEFHHFLED